MARYCRQIGEWCDNVIVDRERMVCILCVSPKVRKAAIDAAERIRQAKPVKIEEWANALATDLAKLED